MLTYRRPSSGFVMRQQQSGLQRVIWPAVTHSIAAVGRSVLSVCSAFLEPAFSVWHRIAAAYSWSEADRLRSLNKVLMENELAAEQMYVRAVRERKGCDAAIAEFERSAIRAELRGKGLAA